MFHTRHKASCFYLTHTSNKMHQYFHLLVINVFSIALNTLFLFATEVQSGHTVRIQKSLSCFRGENLKIFYFINMHYYNKRKL